MKKIFSILFLAITLTIPAFLCPGKAFANSLEYYVVNDQMFVGAYSGVQNVYAELNFNRSGNAFWWKIFFLDLKTVNETIITSWDAKTCDQQVRWLYINTARGNRVRPLDEDSLLYLKSVDASYDNLTMTGGLFICSGDANSIVWYIQHTRKGQTYSLIAGLQYDLATNDFLPMYAPGWNFLFSNGTSTWYLRDSYGWIAQLSWLWLNTTSVCGNALVETGESCDEWSGVNWQAGHCSLYCKNIITAICGNAIVETGETCDEWMNLNGQPGHCNHTCNGVVTQNTSSGNPTLNKDICLNNRDCSSSYYDNLCGPCPSDHASAPLCDVSHSTYSDEFTTAYQRACSVGITTMPSIERANMSDTIIRKHMAKMMTEFAIKILHKKPDFTATCSFTDTGKDSEELQFYMRTVCQLGLMWLKSDGTPDTMFTSNGILTRAQFGTILSRLLYGDTYNGKPGKRYEAHLKALNAAGIMKDISKPMAAELRGYILLMMMRVDENMSPTKIVDWWITALLSK